MIYSRIYIFIDGAAKMCKHGRLTADLNLAIIIITYVYGLWNVDVGIFLVNYELFKLSAKE